MVFLRLYSSLISGFLYLYIYGGRCKFRILGYIEYKVGREFII